ncbi:response regulator [Candidatus Bathyarchaeota archaeon]|nr:response regulator [Candidatus Bathyarchaeota archaeon]MBS7631028.1 response regulator [Candidatus Bathyarchaeota archaeon]
MTENRRVLLVDDEESLLNSFSSILEAEGFEVTMAQTSKEALQKTMEQKFHLYLIDILLPDINGDELVQIIRKFDKNTPIILITGYSSFQDSINLLDLGIHEILLKPISPKELIQACEEAISPNFLATSPIKGD